MTARKASLLQEGHICTLQYGADSSVQPLGANASKLRKFQRQFLCASQEHPKTSRYFKSSAQIANENRRLLYEHPPYVIHPFSRFRLYWDAVLVVVLGLHLCTLAFVFCFLPHLPESYDTALIGVNLLLSTVLAVEFCLQCITGRVVKETREIVLQPKRLILWRIKYFGIVYDMLLFLPYTLLLKQCRRWIVGDGTVYYIVFLVYLYIVNISRFHDINAYGKVALHLLHVTKNYQKLAVKLILDTFHVLHWTACMHYILQLLLIMHQEKSLKQIILSHDVSEGSAWKIDNPYIRLKIDDVDQRQTVWYRYSRNMLVTLKAALQSGHPIDIDSHFIYKWIMCVVVVGGWAWCTYLLLQLIHPIRSSKLSESKYEEILQQIKAYAYNKRLSGELEEKMVRHFASRYRTHYYNEKEIMGIMTENLQRSVRREVCQHLVANVGLFHDLPTNLINDIVDRLRLEIFLEDDVIIQAGTNGDAMYFLAYGTVSVLNPAGREVGHLVDGAHFGEISLLKRDQKRTASVIALEVCEIYRLSHKDFHMLLEPHANLLNRMRRLAEERLAKLQMYNIHVAEVNVYDNFLQ